jgi:lantibiotic modifying enzyme
VIREITTAHDIFRDAARRIGESICARAIWNSEGRECNWMGTALPRPEDDAPGGLVCASLWPGLYGGSAGIALFLAELYRLAPDGLFARTAVGALRRSARVVGTTSKNDSALSFFTGELGVAYAIHRASVSKVGETLQDDFTALVTRVVDAFALPHGLDLMVGNAGAIPALLRMRRLPGCEGFEALVPRCADELVEAANWDDCVATWDPKRASGPEMAAPAPLTGLSHGASGIALGLLEAYEYFAEERYLRAARGAFAYEDRLYDEDASNWIDVSRPFERDTRGARGLCQTAWCHGAPGITLARLRARDLDTESADAHDVRARVALATTVGALRANLDTPGYDTSLCHGLIGLAQVTAIGAEMLGNDDYRDTARAATAALLERYGESERWPTGTWHASGNPSLMVGLAGIGHHLLRLAEPSVPPVLAFAAAGAS